MKKILAILILALFVISGCGQQAEDDSAAREAAQAAEKPVGDKIADAPSTVLSQELKDSIEATLTKGTKFAMPLNYRKMEYGDSFVFGVGVQSVKTKAYEFGVKVEFKKAYGNYMSPIDVDEDLLNGWVKSKLQLFELDQNDKKIVPIRIEVGEMRPGIPAGKGTYVFDVEVFFSEFDSVGTEEYTNTELSVKIME